MDDRNRQFSATKFIIYLKILNGRVGNEELWMDKIVQIKDDE